MELYKQTDSRWKNIQLGTCPDETIGSAGCFITVLGMMAGITPPEVNTALIQGRGYSNGCLVIFKRAAALLGLLEEGRGATVKRYPCIAWTDNFASKGIPQHFFVVLNENEIIDPLTGTRKKNPYRIKEYVHIYPKETLTMTERQELDQLRSVKNEIINGKQYEFRIEGTPSVYQVYAIPSPAHFEFFQNKWENIKEIPNWGGNESTSTRLPNAVSEIFALRNTITQTQAENAQLHGKIEEVEAKYKLSEVDVEGLNDDIERIQKELDAEKAAHDATKKVLHDQTGIYAAPESDAKIMDVDEFLFDVPAISLIKALISKLFGK